MAEAIIRERKLSASSAISFATNKRGGGRIPIRLKRTSQDPLRIPDNNGEATEGCGINGENVLLKGTDEENISPGKTENIALSILQPQFVNVISNQRKEKESQIEKTHSNRKVESVAKKETKGSFGSVHRRVINSMNTTNIAVSRNDTENRTENIISNEKRNTNPIVNVENVAKNIPVAPSNSEAHSSLKSYPWLQQSDIPNDKKGTSRSIGADSMGTDEENTSASTDQKENIASAILQSQFVNVTRNAANHQKEKETLIEKTHSNDKVESVAKNPTKGSFGSVHRRVINSMNTTNIAVSRNDAENRTESLSFITNPIVNVENVAKNQTKGSFGQIQRETPRLSNKIYFNQESHMNEEGNRNKYLIKSSIVNFYLKLGEHAKVIDFEGLRSAITIANIYYLFSTSKRVFNVT